MSFKKYHKESNLVVEFQMNNTMLWNLLNNSQRQVQVNLLVLYLILVKKWLYLGKNKLNRKELLKRDK